MASQTMKSAKPENPFAPPLMQAHLTKMKQEEEEELWISGEELYTEGSSDEDDYRPGARNRRRTTNNKSSQSSSTNTSLDQQSRPVEEQESGVSTAAARLNTANPANKTHTKPAADSMIKDDASINLKQAASSAAKQNVEPNSEEIAIAGSSNEMETDVKISWKVNRGSFILPKTNNTDEKRNGC